MIEAIYKAKATATGGREGNVKSSDGILDLNVQMPKEMGGKGGGFTNPEQLFAAGYAACFDSALNLVARTQKIRLENTETTVIVGIGKNEADGFGLDVDIEVKIPGVEKELAEKLIAQAHQVCPYSNATRGNIRADVKLV